MRKTIVLLFASSLLLMACSNQNTLQSWAHDVVTWNHEAYKVTAEVVTDIEDEIGTIKRHSTNEASVLPNLFSNKYEKGTKLFKIKDVDTAEYIAVQADGVYYKAEFMAGKMVR